MTIRVEIGGREEIKRALQAARKDALRGLARQLVKEAEGIMRLSKSEVPVDQGILRTSGFVSKPVPSRIGMSITMGYGGAAMPYALYMHEGTGPAVGRPQFHPPVKPFMEWAKRVLGDESLGPIIARAVGRKGLKPRKYLERPFRKRARGMGLRLAKAMRQEMR